MLIILRLCVLSKDEVTGEWRKLHNEELNDLYSSPNIVRVIKSRRIRWTGHVACMGERRGVYSVLMGKPEGKRPLGRPRRRWEDNIKMYLQQVFGTSRFRTVRQTYTSKYLKTYTATPPD